MALWYYLQKGRPVGPVSTEELKREIVAGGIGPSDLLYLERDTTWKPASSFGELQAAFPATGPTTISAPVASSQGVSEWVLLIRKADGSGYRQRGPFTQGQILTLVKNGEVVWTDHVWRKGLKEWYKIMALPEFQPDYRPPVQEPAEPTREAQSATDIQSLPEQIYKSVADDTSERELNLSAELSAITHKLPLPSDDETTFKSTFITQTEATRAPLRPTDSLTQSASYFKLEEGTATTPPAKKSSPPKLATKPEKTSRAEVIEKVERPRQVEAVEKPDDDEKDAAKAKDKDKVKAKVRRSHRRPKVNPMELVRRISFVNYYLELTFVRKILLLTSTGAVMVSGIFLLTYLSSYLDRKNIVLHFPDAAFVQPQLNPPTGEVGKVGGEAGVTPSGATPVPGGPEDLAKRQPPPVEAPRVPPTYLKYLSLQNGTENPRVRLLTDGSYHFPITLVFSSGAGRVLRNRSYARLVRVSRTDERDLDLSKLNLPPGYYDITMTMGDLKSFGRIGVGILSSDFKRKLAAHRKQLLFDYNEERYSFLKTVGRLETEANKFVDYSDNVSNVKSWTGFYKDWRLDFGRVQNQNLKKITGKNRNQFVLADRWLELKGLQGQVESESKRYNGMKQKAAGLSNGEMKALAAKLSKLKERMLEDSLFD